jgi:ABC-type polysaccharide/polyol phosphate export permease
MPGGNGAIAVPMLETAPPSLETATAAPLDDVQPSRAARALADLREGLSKSWVWLDLAKRDIRGRYRGSVIGPFWLTLSVTILIAVIGTIYTQLLKHEPSEYLPYIAVGLVLWQFIGGTLNGGCTTFTSAEGIMQQARMPLSVHVFRQTSRQLITLAHTAVIVPVVLLLFQPDVGWGALLAIPGLAVLAFNAFWVNALLGMISARFRDVPQIIASMMQILFFITPVFWFPDMLGTLGMIGRLNPLYASIDVIRAPILGVAVHWTSWPVLLALTTAGAAATFALFARFRSRIVFWV